MLKWIIIGFIILFVLACFGVAFMVQWQTFKSSQIDPDTALGNYDYYADRYPRREVSFLSGKNRLKGYVYGEDNKKALLVFCHGIWSGPEEYLMMLTWFVDQGYQVFTYSNTSYNGSQGKWAKGLFQSPLDLNAALNYIESQETFQGLPILLLGHSWGGFAVTSGLSFHPEVEGVAALSGFNQPLEMSDSVAHKMFGRISILFTLPSHVINRILFPKYMGLTAVKGINHTQAPVLLVHGTNDDFIYYNETSILSKKDQITNPGLCTITLDDGKYAAHNTYFLSKESEDYLESCDAEWKEMAKGLKKDEIRSKKHDFYQTVDLDRSNQPNVELFTKIRNFYEEKCLGEN